MTEEEFNKTIKELNVVLLDVDYTKFETPLDVAKFVISLAKVNSNFIFEENEKLKTEVENLQYEGKRLLEDNEKLKKKVLVQEEIIIGEQKEKEKNEGVIKRANEIITQLNADIEIIAKEKEKLKAGIEEIKKIMNLNDYCENIYHYLTCELSLYKADEFDCEVCRYAECSKRLKPYELE